MAWTDITKREHKRNLERYPSDLTHAKWSVVEPFVPPPRSGGRPRTTNMREVLNGTLYLAQGGIPWCMLPKDFPPISTVRVYFYDWRNDGTLALMNFVLVQMARELENKERCPSAGVIDSQSVKTTESGGVCGYADDKLKDALKGKGDWTIKVLKRSDDVSGFVVLPRRWVVERTFAWLGRCRRLAKDWEKSIKSSTAWTIIAHIRILMRWLARYRYVRKTFESDSEGEKIAQIH